MSEKLLSEKRHEKKGEIEPNKEIDEQRNKLQKKAEKDASSAKNEHAEKLDEIRSKIETEAKGKHEKIENPTSKLDKDLTKKDDDQRILVNNELKDISYRRTIKKTQAKLSATSRTFSKVVHQPVVEKVSEIGSKTIARPSGILFGGIFSFIGSSFFLWTARHYGYRYNFLLFMLFFIGGFFLGLAIELTVRILRSKR